MENAEDYITKKTYIERVTLICPMAQRAVVNEWLDREGFQVIRSGPYGDKDIFPKVDTSRYLVVAEVELEEQP